MKMQKSDIFKFILLLVLSIGISNIAHAQLDCDDDDDDECMVPGGCDPSPPDSIDIPRLHAVDPNDIIGPVGYDTAQWMSVKDLFGYTIRFENDPDFATGPAQIVKVNAVIDPHLNLPSVRIGQFGFGDFIFTPPPNSSFYADRLDVRDSLGVYVDVIAGIDITKGEVFWIFESIDPITGLAPLDGNTGFLPVNDSTVTIYTDTITQKGEGFVSFNISPKSNSQTGDSVKQNATIIFDQNEEIPTNTWTNIIDALPPTTIMDSLPPNSSELDILLSWSSTDDPGGVGVRSYDLYVSKDSAQYKLHTAKIDTTSISFFGKQGSYYQFYIRAKDHVGNVEEQKFIEDAFTQFGANVEIATRVFLQGPYIEADTLMDDQLRIDGVLPQVNPYAAKGLKYATAEQAVNSAEVLTNTGGNDAIVDWIYIELVEMDADTAIMGGAYLLQRDGDIVDHDGISPVVFQDAPQGMYQLAIYHRNHLPVLTGDNIFIITNEPASLDLTKDINFVVGGQNAVIEVGGRYLMISGDVDQNGQIQNTDIITSMPKIGLSGYLAEDVDMNGQVQNIDIQQSILPNLGRGKQFNNE
jgi:hypothetical protein